MDIEKVLEERGKDYGDFADNARVAQELKSIIAKYSENLNPIQREALEMIAVKMSRLLTKNSFHVDGWQDIAGYATLVVKDLGKTSTRLQTALGAIARNG